VIDYKMNKELRTCDICGKKGNVGYITFLVVANVFCCKKHRWQYEKFGKFLDNNPRGIKDRNQIIEHDNYAEMVLYNKNSEEIARALIDIEDVEKVRNMKWRKTGGHVSSDIKGRSQILLHRFIMGVDDVAVDVDHIDRNILNNRKINLRICSHQENTFNSSLSKNNTSGFIGISWSKSKNKWEPSLFVNGKRVYLGRFDELNDAIIARLKAEKEYFGEFAPQRHLFDQYGI